MRGKIKHIVREIGATKVEMLLQECKKNAFEKQLNSQFLYGITNWDSAIIKLL